MINSNSAIIIKTKSEVVSIQDRHSYLEKEQFYSIEFFNDEKTYGQIHWSNSFYYGKLNVVDFVKKGEYFFLFTSTIQNYLVLEMILNKVLGENIKLEVVKLPLFSNLKIIPKSVVFLKIDPYFGLSVKISLKNKHYFVKIYTNGLVTFPLILDHEIIITILEIALEMVNNSYDSRMDK